MSKNEHAVVMGSSIAGLLAARVLSEHFSKVTLIERDAHPLRPLPREGVPQGKQTHVLLPGGTRVLEKLFPGCVSKLAEIGAQQFDYGYSRFHLDGHWMPRVETGLISLAQTRPFLEQHVRSWVSSISNVTIVYGSTASGLKFDAGKSRVVGIHVRDTQKTTSYEIQADLVVDSTGRNTRLPHWLVEGGYGRVPITEIEINVGYATGLFRTPKELLPDHPLMYIVGRPPEKTRVGAFIRVEDGLACAGLAGYHGDFPPTELQQFLKFARSLCDPKIYDVLAQSELASTIAQFRVPASIRRHYRRLTRFPDGIIPIGDSISSFDPVFAQGMTVAALEVEVLSECLRGYVNFDANFRRNYFQRIDSLVDVAWNLSSGENFRYPQTSGRRPLFYGLERRYKSRLLSSTDPFVIRGLYRVLTLSANPKILLDRRIVTKALFN